MTELFPNEIIDIGSLCSKRGSLLAQIQALNWPSWELRCHAWALCHMWVFESLLLHFWASYWFPQTLAKSTESSSSISHPSPLALAIFWGFSLKVLHFSVFKTFSEFFSWIWRNCTVGKNCSSDLEKLLKFEAEGQEFAKFLRSLEHFFQTVRGQNNFWYRMLF